MQFQLTIGTTTKYYKAPAGREKEMLAVALTAMANNKMVYVFTDLAAVTQPILIKNLMLK